MSLCSSYRRISTNLLPPSSSILKTLPAPPSSFHILSFPSTKLRLRLSKSFTVRSTPSKPPSPDPSLETPSNFQIFEQLPQKLQEIVKLFQSVQDPKAKYEQLLFYGKNLKPLDAQFKTDQNKVKGCVSQVWLRAYFDDLDKKNVIFEADSDALITKGLAALLVQGLSGSPVQEILRISPDFIVLLGLQQSLSPSRNSGFLNMFQLMQKKALMLYVDAEKGIESTTGNVENPLGSNTSSDVQLTTNLAIDDSSLNGLVLGNRGQRIREILNKELQPVALELEDVSYQHAGHAGVRGSSNGETHFNLKVVSKEFEGKSLVKRHRLIYSLLDDELQSGLHALSIEARTPAEVGNVAGPQKVRSRIDNKPIKDLIFKLFSLMGSSYIESFSLYLKCGCVSVQNIKQNKQTYQYIPTYSSFLLVYIIARILYIYNREWDLWFRANLIYIKNLV